jgi:Flp pilus assembly pilin Flp
VTQTLTAKPEQANILLEGHHMKFLNLIKNFRNDDSGAVTVDWVVLTAAMVGLGIAVVATVGGGIGTMGSTIDTALSGAAIGTDLSALGQ